LPLQRLHKFVPPDNPNRFNNQVTIKNTTNGLRGRIVSGASWMILFRLTERSLGLINTIILARILVPADFGLVAMATTVVALLEIFTMNDFGGAIIQNPNATRVDYDTAFTMEVILGIGAAIAIALLSIPAAMYFEDPRLTPILLVLALYPLLDAFYNVGCVDFRKNLQFDKEFRFQVVRKISGFVVCIPLALILRNYWAMIFGMLAGRFGFLIASYYMHPFRPRWSLQAAGRIWAYSKWLMVNNALAFLTARSAHMIIGRVEDSRALGLYSVSFDFANLPTSELSMPINRAVFPGLSKLQDDPDRLKHAFLQVFSMVTLMVLPAGFGVAAVAPTLVPLVLGAKWHDAIPLVQILAVGGAVYAMHANLESLYFAKGLTRMRARISAIQVAVMVPTMFWCTVHYGLIGAATAYLATSLVVATYNVWNACTLVEVSTKELFAVLWRPVLASVSMFAVVYFLWGRPDVQVSTAHLAVGLLARIGTGVLSYLVVIYLLWRAAGCPIGAETSVRVMAGAVLNRLKRSSRT
jgi:O-antigen/teichoic acid export membrane protein